MKWEQTQDGYAIRDHNGIRGERYEFASEAGMDIVMEAITDRRAIYAAFAEDQRRDDDAARRAKA